MARDDLARLALLHAEAAETARLANILGRAPITAAALAVGAGLTAVLVRESADAAATIAWLVLVLVAVGAVARAYTQTIRAPFEIAPLRAFAEDLRAIMLYAGFAWGAGAFLALPAGAGVAAFLLFAGGASALLALSLRKPETALCFIAPVAGLTALSALFAGEAVAAVASLAVCGAIAGTVYAGNRIFPRNPRVPGLASLLAS